MGTPQKYFVKPGDEFGRLTVIKLLPNHRVWCRCDSPAHPNKPVFRRVVKYNLLSKDTQSCGCFQKERAAATAAKTNLTHGLSKTVEAKIWRVMNYRCHHENHPLYKYYGARGIKVCKRWRIKNPNGFQNFLADMGLRPGPKHSLGRKNNDGNYTPRNVSWETPLQQSLNRRNTLFLTYKGIRKPETVWNKKCGFPPCTIIRRIRINGWSLKRSIETPLKKYAPRKKVAKSYRRLVDYSSIEM